MNDEEKIKEVNGAFLSLFNINENSKYFDPVTFNKEFGFSVKRHYEDDVNRVLPKLNKDERYLVLFHVYIDEKERHNDKSIKPVGIRTAMAVDKDRLMFPDNIGIRSPVDIVSRDAYFFDVDNQKFFKKDKEIQPIDILEEMYKSHIKPSRTLRGLLFRSKKNSLSLSSKLIVLISQVLVILARILFNDRYTWDHKRRALETEHPKLFQPKDVKKNAAEKESFFGFPASRWSLFMYCIMHLCGYLVFKDYPKFLFIRPILTNTFLSLAYVFVSLSLYEKYMPLLFEYLIRQTTVFGYRILDRPLKI